MAALTATRSTYRASTESTLVRDITSEMQELEPDFAPLYVLTNAAKRKEACKSPKFEWYEDKEVPLMDKVNNGTSDYASNVTAIVVTDGTLFGAGDLLAVLKADTATSAEEIVLVTGVSGNTLTVTRGIGGAGADTIGATNTLYIIGTAHLEGGTLSNQRYQPKTQKYSYCQIFKDSVKITDSMEATEQYVNPEGERDYQTYKTMKRHRQQIELAGLLGRGSESLAEPGSRRTTQGLKPSIATNTLNINTTLTYASLLSFGQKAFRYGSAKKLLIAAPAFIAGCSGLSAGKLITNVKDKVFGVSIKEVEVAHGTWQLANNFRMEDGGYGGAGLDDEAFSVDLAAVRFRYLGGNGKNRDTKLYKDVVADGSEVKVDEIRSEVGWQIMNEQKHAWAYNCSAW